MTIYEKLARIQTGLKAPKNRTNSFGGYSYRNCEDILEAVKPFLSELNCVLLLKDDVADVGGRIYIKAVATLVNVDEPNESVSCTAFAREEETKKGMDASQITGASSSYARKYALNGLFCLDDNKDSDTTNTGGKEDRPAPKAAAKQAPAGQTCTDCGKPIDDKVFRWSSDFYGMPLCRDCQKSHDRRR